VPYLQRIEELSTRAAWSSSETVRGYLVAHVATDEAARLAKAGGERARLERFLVAAAKADESLRGLMLFVYGDAPDATGFVELVLERDGALTWMVSPTQR
jgi:hypothetical protein